MLPQGVVDFRFRFHPHLPLDVGFRFSSTCSSQALNTSLPSYPYPEAETVMKTATATARANVPKRDVRRPVPIYGRDTGTSADAIEIIDRKGTHLSVEELRDTEGINEVPQENWDML